MSTAVLVAADLPPGQPWVSPDDLSAITPLWQEASEATLIPIVAQVYNDAAGTLHTSLVGLSDGAVPAITSLASEQYLAAARNTFTQVGNDLWETARSELLDGFQKGESIPELRDRLRQSAGLTNRRATYVARTQVLDASNAGSYDTAQASGLDLVKGWEATPDLRTRETHLMAASTYSGPGMIPMAETFMVGGWPCERPHDPELPPEERYNCRCTTVYAMRPVVIDRRQVYLDDLAAQHQAKLDVIRARYERRLAQIQARHEANLAAIQVTSVTPSVSVEQAIVTSETRLAQAVAAHEARVARLTADYEFRQAKLMSDYNYRVAKARGEEPPTLPSQPAPSPATPPVQAGQDLLDPSVNLPADPSVTALAEIQGFDVPITLATEAQIRQLIAQGWTEIWRGVKHGGGKDALTISRQFTEGSYRPGGGLFGRGFYFTADRNTAEVYRGAQLRFGRDYEILGVASDGESGGLLHAALSPTARVIDFDTLQAERETFISQLKSQGLLTADVEEKLLKDPGLYAAARGYDAIRVTGRSDGVHIDDWPDQYVVLNRSAVVGRIVDEPEIPLPSVPAPTPQPIGPLGALATKPVEVPVRASLMQATTVPEVRAAFIREWRDVIAAEPGAIRGSARFLTTGDVQTAREHAEGLLRAIERFPMVRIDVTHGRMAQPEHWAETAGRMISFSDTYARARDDYLLSLRLSGIADPPDVAWHPMSISSPQAIAMHEFGHAFQFSIARNRAGQYTYQALTAISEEARDIARVYGTERYASSGPFSFYDAIGREIGGYARTDGYELISEAFADVMVNGDAASELSKRIVAMLIRRYEAQNGPMVGPSLTGLPKLPAGPRLTTAPLVDDGLDAMTVADLKALAKTRGITDLPAGARKPQLIQALRAQVAADRNLANAIAEAIDLMERALASGNAARARTALADAIKLLQDTPGAELALRAANLAPTGARTVIDRLRRLAAQRGLTLPTGRQLSALKTARAKAVRTEKARLVAIKKQTVAINRGEFEHLTAGAEPGVFTTPDGGSWLVEAFATEQEARERALYAVLHQLVTGNKGAPPPTFVIGRGAPGLKGWQVAYPGMSTSPLPGEGVSYWLTAPVARLQALTPARIRALVAKIGLDPKLADELIEKRATAIASARAFKPVVRLTITTPGETRLVELSAQTPIKTRSLTDGAMADVTRLEYPDGTVVIQKLYENFIGPNAQRDLKWTVDGEELGARVLDAVGVRSPAVIQMEQRGRILMEYIDGDVGGGPRISTSAYNAIADSDDGRLMGLADFLMANTDRNSGNWLLRARGRLAGIDHGEAFRTAARLEVPPEGNFTYYLMRHPTPDSYVSRLAATLDIAPEDLAIIRRRLEGLRERFAEMGRLAWFRQMMARLAEVEARATGTRRLI